MTTISAYLAAAAAAAIRDAFDLYQHAFRRITRRAQSRFETQDWHGHERDSVERLNVYKQVVDRIVAEARVILGEHVRERSVWTHMRATYSDLVARRNDIELAETFFNSVTRRIFATVGVDPAIEFVDSDFAVVPDVSKPLYRTYAASDAPVSSVIEQILRDTPFSLPIEDLARSARLSAAEITAHLSDVWGEARFEAIEVIPSIFYRNKGAYLVGRIRREAQTNPLILALRNEAGRILIDAVLLTGDEASNVFSYTRSYFHVITECPYLLVDFLKSIMPLKRRAELYTAAGYNKHGKTELYRDLYCHLQCGADRFELAQGEKGMVMAVFSMPSFGYVFKVIKDAFPHPKRTTRADVLSRYQLVFTHDRAGRLVDAQEFEHLAVDRARFTDEALAELLTQCSNTVSLVGDAVDIKHLYTERLLTPLNLYVREQPFAEAAAAVVDYGQAIKDLAATNIFPGDLFLKNFGVTRHGRVVFYDYDELCLLTQCNFRRIPQARDSYDDFGDAQPWFSVAENDVFPEEFRSFLGLDRPLQDVFFAAHSDLLDAGWWREVQARLQAGEVMDLVPYPPSRRLGRSIFRA